MEVTGHGESAVAGVHDEEDVFRWDQIGVPSQLIPADQRTQVAGVAVHRDQKADLSPLAGSRIPVAGEEYENAVVSQNSALIGEGEEGAEDVRLGSLPVLQQFDVFGREPEP